LRLAPCIPAVDGTLVGADGQFHLPHYEFGKVLGEGMSGSVVQLCTDGQPSGMVVKMQPKSSIALISDFRVLKRTVEISFLLSSGPCAHPNIVQLFEVFQSPTHILLQMEDAGPENLYQRLVQRCRDGPSCRPIPADKAASILTQSLVILKHLHCHCSVCHRDFKPENFIVCDAQDELTLKLADFDMAVVTKPGSLCFSPCGTIPFVAPEVMLEKGYNGMLADIWSMGIVLTEVLGDVRVLENVLRLKNVIPRPGEKSNQTITRAIKSYFEQPGSVVRYISEQCRCELRTLLPVCAPLLDGMLKTETSERWEASRSSETIQELWGV